MELNAIVDRYIAQLLDDKFVTSRLVGRKIVQNLRDVWIRDNLINLTAASLAGLDIFRELRLAHTPAADDDPRHESFGGLGAPPLKFIRFLAPAEGSPGCHQDASPLVPFFVQAFSAGYSRLQSAS